MLLRQWLLATAQQTGVSRQPANKISLPKLDSASPLAAMPAAHPGPFHARARETLPGLNAREESTQSVHGHFLRLKNFLLLHLEVRRKNDYRGLIFQRNWPCDSADAAM